MRPFRILGSGCLCCALVLVLTLTGGTAQATMLEGSITISASMVTQDSTTLATSNEFTTWAMTGWNMSLFKPIVTANNLNMSDGDSDFEDLPFTIIAAETLYVNDIMDWGFTSLEGNWETDTFTLDNARVNEGYLEFLLTGNFNPEGAGGTLDGLGFTKTPATIRISMNQSGSAVSWAATMTMIPEPMTMSLLGLGGLALLRRRRRLK